MKASTIFEFIEQELSGHETEPHHLKLTDEVIDDVLKKVMDNVNGTENPKKMERWIMEAYVRVYVG